jgi:hypothetical protein
MIHAKKGYITRSGDISLSFLFVVQSEANTDAVCRIFVV